MLGGVTETADVRIRLPGGQPRRRTRFGPRERLGTPWSSWPACCRTSSSSRPSSTAPIIVNFYYSTLNWSLGSDTATVIGLGNYRRFFSGGDAGSIFETTLVFTVATVGGAMILGLLLATVLNQKLRGSTFARATVFAPFVLSGVGIGLVWVFLFDPTTGALSAILRSLGLTSPNWFLDPHLSLTMVIIVYVWKNLGYCAVIYLAAMRSVPVDLLEAASIDGASAPRRFFSIVLPLISPTTFFLLLTSILGSLQAFDLLNIMSPQGTGTMTLMFASYWQAFHIPKPATRRRSRPSCSGSCWSSPSANALLERRVHYR